MIRKLCKKYAEWELSVNCNQYMCVGGEASDKNVTVESCKEYNYLGTKMDQGGRTEKEVVERMVKGKRVI